MSIEVQQKVRKSVFGSPNRKAVAIRLSDAASDDGSGIWMAVETIATETELSERTVQRILHQFVEEGILVLVREASGVVGIGNHYDMSLQAIAKLPQIPPRGRRNRPAKDAGSDAATGDTVSPVGPIVTGDTDDMTGDTVSPHGCHGDTRTVIEPSIEPSREREGARERDQSFDREEGQTAETGPDETQKGLEKRFRVLEFGSGGKSIPWPNAAGSSSAWGLKQFVALSPEDRRKAEELRDAYLAICPKYSSGPNKGQPKPVALGVYLRDRKFLLVEAMPKKAESTDSKADRAPPFGPAWGAKRMALLLEGPAELPARSELRELFENRFGVYRRTDLGMALRFAERCGVTVSRDNELAFPDDFEERELARRTLEGFPGVNALDRAARDRRFEPVEAGFVALAEEMEPVPVGTDMWRRWEDWHADNHLPFVPETGNQRVVYFPKGGPSGLEAFKRAAQAATNQEAAE
ncbi:helix-turn-helix domain-containing protein [Martelella mangrovi]|uniref:Helix-turn-helix domain-containing protein n=1 Tax=Martelella mangrovi TaxID=1397477 RepID=A0ABV2IFW1_9HYPH